MASTGPHSTPLLGLPAELLLCIAACLPNRDIKNLRLTCRAIHAQIELRLRRVFLSAHRLDVEVFRAVADHDALRLGVTEIIWDDAFLRADVVLGLSEMSLQTEERRSNSEFAGRVRRTRQKAYTTACHENNFNLSSRYQYDLQDRPQRLIAAQLSPEKSLVHYAKAYGEQESTIRANDDLAALRYGLPRFPALRRISVTPATHGITLGFPLYETPAIRALPRGLNYPLPNGWLRTGEGEPQTTMPMWIDINRGGWNDAWRGVRTVLEVLAEHVRQRQRQEEAGQEAAEAPRVMELVLDAHQLDAGLNSHVFYQRCRAYDDLVTVLRQPGFRRLDLVLAVGGQMDTDWPSLSNGLLREALGALGPDLEHLRFATDMLAGAYLRLVSPEEYAHTMEHLLRAVFPPDLQARWPRLRHFALTGFALTRPSLLALLRMLPASLRTLELGDLDFLDHGTDGSWHTALEDMRDTLGWRDRPPEDRPRVSVWINEVDGQRRPGRAVWVDKSVAAFLYGGGQNPFGLDDGRFPNYLNPACPSVIRDAFDRDYERPNVSLSELMRRGYIKLSPASAFDEEAKRVRS